MSDYEEYEPSPTFSSGSYGKRGANARALASRNLASKNAISVASRAVAQSLSSINQNNIKTQPSNTHYLLNTNAILVAQKKATNLSKNVKAEPYTIPIPIIKRKEPDIPPATIFYKQAPVIINPIQIISESSEYHKKMIESTMIVKAMRLEERGLMESRIPLSLRKPAREIQYSNIESIDKLPFDVTQLSILCNGLSNILKDNSISIEVLNEFKKYEDSIHSQNEIQQHKVSMDKVRRIKYEYFP